MEAFFLVIKEKDGRLYGFAELLEVGHCLFKIKEKGHIEII